MTEETKSTERPRIDQSTILSGRAPGNAATIVPPVTVAFTAPMLASLAAAINAAIIHKQAGLQPPLFTASDAHRVMRSFQIAQEFHTPDASYKSGSIEDQLAAALGVPAGRAA